MLDHAARASRRSALFPLSVDALAHRVKKRVGRLPRPAEVADEVVEINAPEEQEITPPFFLPGQLERAKGSCEETPLAYELERARAHRVRHEATLALRFDRALMIDGVVYANGARVQQVLGRERLAPRWVKGPELESVALPSTVIGNRYFGHFIAEDCCAALLAREHAPVFFTAADAPRSAHARRYLELYGLPLAELRTAVLRDVWLFQDFAMTTSKQERYRRLREKVRAIPGSRRGHGVFFRRRGAGVERGLANEPELEERLAREGFEIVDVTREDVDTILARTRDAKIVCGVEGSALVHGLLSMSEGGSVVCIQPPYRFNLALKDHSDAMGMRYGIVVGEGSCERFRVSVDELMRTIELA